MYITFINVPHLTTSGNLLFTDYYYCYHNNNDIEEFLNVREVNITQKDYKEKRKSFKKRRKKTINLLLTQATELCRN